MMKIEYKYLPGFGNRYKVYNNGQIFKYTGKELKPNIYKCYARVKFTYHGKHKRFTLSHLIAELFIPNPNPKIYTIVKFKDGNKLNCAADNLYWDMPLSKKLKTKQHINLDMEQTIYKPLPGFEGLYSIGNDGSILKHKGNIKLNAHNYYRFNQKGISTTSKTISIMVNGKTYSIPLARTVAELFIENPNPKEYKFVDYKDGNRDNCRADNLMWVKHKVFTQKEKPVNHGIKFHIDKDGHSKLRYS